MKNAKSIANIALNFKARLVLLLFMLPGVNLNDKTLQSYRFTEQLKTKKKNAIALKPNLFCSVAAINVVSTMIRYLFFYFKIEAATRQNQMKLQNRQNIHNDNNKSVHTCETQLKQ